MHISEFQVLTNSAEMIVPLLQYSVEIFAKIELNQLIFIFYLNIELFPFANLKMLNKNELHARQITFKNFWP